MHAPQNLLQIKGMNMLKKILVAGISSFLGGNVLAGEMGVYEPNLSLDWTAIISLSGGPAWTSPGREQNFYSSLTSINEHFIADKKSSTLGTGEIYFGLQHSISSTLAGQFGVGFAAASAIPLSGMVDFNGVANVTTYRYKVSPVRAEFKGKLIATNYRMLQPYLSASLGVGFNHSYQYFPTSINSTLYPPSFFTDQSNVTFAYTVGAGIQKMITPNWQVGVGYEFADWGESSLAGDGKFFRNGPSLPHLYTNELLFSLSYLF